jgi:hypothetical protein
MLGGISGFLVPFPLGDSEWVLTCIYSATRQANPQGNGIAGLAVWRR